MKNLRTLRTAKGFSQQGLAQRAGITQAAVSQIEAGLHDPRYSTVLRLAYGLGAEPEDLISSPSGPASPGPAVAAGNGASHVV